MTPEPYVLRRVMPQDTAGQERFHALGPIYYRDADGVNPPASLLDPSLVFLTLSRRHSDYGAEVGTRTNLRNNIPVVYFPLGVRVRSCVQLHCLCTISRTWTVSRG